VPNADGSFNSPANNDWTLDVYRFDNSQVIPITFLATGNVDLNKTSTTAISDANSILPSTLTTAETENFWRLINWIFVSLYWTVLYDVGAVSPTIYPDSSSWWVASTLPSTNNIFVNSTLFNIYSTFYNSSAANDSLSEDTLPRFQPVGQGNQLTPVDTTFWRSYACTQRQPKQPVSYAQQLLVGLCSLVPTGLSIFAFFLTLYYKRQAEGSSLGAEKY
jgi:hypothetical protein